MDTPLCPGITGTLCRIPINIRVEAPIYFIYIKWPYTWIRNSPLFPIKVKGLASPK